MMRVKVQVPATSANLGPGFDCLGLALDLHNIVTLDVTAAPSDPIIDLLGEGYDRLPRTGRNLALRAAQRVLDLAPSRLYIARLTLHNNIPIGSGLGSSAAAIAGAMVAADAAIASGLDLSRLLAMALEFEPHPDNLAPALYGGLTVAVLTAPGEPVVATFPPPDGLSAVVLTPDLSISTRQSRASLPRSVSHEDATYTVGRAALLVAALLSGRHDLLRAGMDDRLHQPYRAQAYPAMKDIIAAALEAGAHGAALSGSGPSVLALCSGPTDHIGAAMHEAAEHAGLLCRVRHLPVAPHGATVVSTGHVR